MAFSVSKSRPFRSLGLYRSSGKHAAPKGSVPTPRKAPEGAEAAITPEQSASHQPAHHAATSPRLTSPGAPAKFPGDRAVGDQAVAAEKTAA